MALFTFPAVEKNRVSVFVLSKSELFALPKVIADPYFSIQANLKEVVVEYNSNPGNQKELLVFDAQLSAPSSQFLVSDRARESFLLERVILVDFDEGTLVLERADLPPGLDVIVS